MLTACAVLLCRVLNEKDEAVELFSSVECKGIIGNDNRHYVLDLLRTFPPDANFLPGVWPVVLASFRSCLFENILLLVLAEKSNWGDEALVFDASLKSLKACRNRCFFGFE